jgi:hypothetical protein
MGGEEFALLLPQTTAPQALAWQRICVCALRNAGGSLGGSIPYSVSMGLAPWQPGISFTELYRHADQALYAAKQAGRNQVTQADLPSWHGGFSATAAPAVVAASLPDSAGALAGPAACRLRQK